MKRVLPGYKSFPFGPSSRLCIAALITILTLAGCGNQDETAADSQQSSTLSFKISDSLLGSKLDQTAGTLTVRIQVGSGAFQTMTISGDGLTASLTLDNIPVGATDFTIEITYELVPFGPLVVALGTKTITVVEGGNTLSFATTDFDTASFDEDGDGVSNLVELDENSTTSPVVAICVLDASLLGECELGS